VTASAKFVEEEQWSQAEVPAATQKLVDLIVASAVADPSEFTLPQVSGPSNTNGETNGDHAGKAAKHILVEGRPYFAVSASLRCLESLADYLRVVMNISLLTTDAMSKVIEFLKVGSPVSIEGRAHNLIWH
jgi:vacuolar protein sorting-associated protein 54